MGACLQFIDRPPGRIHDRADVFVQLLVPEANDAKAAEAESLSFTVHPNPERRLGLLLKMGKITAVEHGSPANKAGVVAGDRIVQVGELSTSDPTFDAMTFPEQTRRAAAGEGKISIKVERDNADVIRIARSGAEIRKTVADGLTAIILGCQNTTPLDGRIRFVELFADLGVRVMQLPIDA